MKSRKPRSNLDKLRRRRGQAVLDLMNSNGLTVERIAQKTGSKTQTVYKTIEGHTPGHEVIAFLEKKLGRAFNDLWINYPDHSAA